jgi:hypothetical protein
VVLGGLGALVLAAFLARAYSETVRARYAPALAAGAIDEAAAGVDLLEQLPGIGPTLAGRIVAERESSGPFASLEELSERVSGLGPALEVALQGRVSFGSQGSPDGPDDGESADRNR